MATSLLHAISAALAAGGNMKTKLLAILLLAGSSLFAGPRVFVGIGVGGYGYAPGYYASPPPPPVAYVPPIPAPGYTWVAGYWYPAGPRWAWRAGYWARPGFARYYGRPYYGHYRR